MRQVSIHTTVGATTDVRAGSDTTLVSEPDVGATLRTKGRFYFLCEVIPPGRQGAEIAREVSELARQEYYYDLSAGIEVSLRKALRDANRRAAAKLRDQHGRIALHCACVVIVGNTLYAVRIGAAQIFLVRRARLFLPGDDPGELADFVHRTTTRVAEALGTEMDLLPTVWKQGIEPQDTVIIAGGGLVERLGAEALLNAAVTLHPRAAASHIHDRFVAEGGTGGDPALFIEIAVASGAAPRLAPPAQKTRPADEVVIAESIRSRVDSIWRHRPRVGRAVSVASAPAVHVATKSIAVGLELLPRRSPPLGRVDQRARARGARQQRITSLLAIGLLAATLVIGGLVVRDFQANQVTSDYQIIIGSVRSDLTSAEGLIERKPSDPEKARLRLDSARSRIAQAATSPAADRTELALLQARVEALADRLASVIIDLAKVPGGAGARITSLTATVNGLYAADPGSGRMWRIFGDPGVAGPVLEKGKGGVGNPVVVAASEVALLTVDDLGKVWRAEGNTVIDITPPDREKWKSVTAVASFVGNLYVLDGQSGQLWKHEEENGKLGPATAYLQQALQPNTVRSFAVDGAVWIATTNGDILRFRRTGLATAAAREDFVPRWQGEPVRATAIQAIDGQRSIYLLDAPGRRIVQLGRDGREVARFLLPADLPEATAFYVSEGLKTAYTTHGSKIASTDLTR
ncbi:MAG TPA: hypothetical protein VM070_05570 [Candidatus Saccharimonadales bacterium]|nr:hypothetical protein [Candidatus Saccharimonadales bacterium]